MKKWILDDLDNMFNVDKIVFISRGESQGSFLIKAWTNPTDSFVLFKGSEEKMNEVFWKYWEELSGQEMPYFDAVLRRGNENKSS